MKKTIGMVVTLASLGASTAATAITEVGETTVMASVQLSAGFRGVECGSTLMTISTNENDPPPLAIITCTSGAETPVKLFVESGNNLAAIGSSSFMMNENGDRLPYVLEAGTGHGDSPKGHVSFTHLIGGIDPSEFGHGLDVPAKGNVVFHLDKNWSGSGTVKPGIYMDNLHVKTFTP